MNTNPYGGRYPGAGRIPQANPSEGGQGGIGSDSLGTQLRDWTSAPILAQILTHGSNAAYNFREVYITSAGTVTARTNGITGSASTNAAYEVNGVTSVNSGTIVELWPQYATPPAWGFVAPGGAANVATTCKTAVVTAYCTSGMLTVVTEQFRVVDVTC